MKVFCSYNKRLHTFLNNVVESILNKYGAQLNIESLEEIELVDKSNFSETDGRVIDCHKIIVTSRLYDLLPSYDIENLKGNKEYKLLRQTLYHEMGHINDMFLMPNLYEYAFADNDRKERIVSQFWLEYIAERRSNGFEGIEHFELCEQFIEGDWECSMSNFDSYFNDSNFAYLIKVLPYFMATTKIGNIREYYIGQLKNGLLVEFINKLDEEIIKLENRELFDDIGVLYNLYNIMKYFYKKFMLAFSKVKNKEVK